MRVHVICVALAGVFLAACSKTPATSDIEPYVRTRVSSAYEVSGLKCEFFEGRMKGAGRASCVGKLHGLEERFAELNENQIAEAIPILAESTGWPEAMPDSEKFLSPQPGQILQQLPRNSETREVRGEFLYMREADRWDFDGVANFVPDQGFPRSHFRDTTVVMGSPEWEQYRNEVVARFEATRGLRDAARKRVEAFFADGGAQYGDTDALDPAKQYHNGIMRLKFPGVQWLVPTRQQFFSKMVASPFQEFHVEATCEWSKPSNSRAFAYGNRFAGPDRPCAQQESNRMSIDGSIYPIGPTSAEYGIRAKVTNGPGSFSTLIFKGDRFVNDGFGSSGMWK